jgi:hypothetical protein
MKGLEQRIRRLEGPALMGAATEDVRQAISRYRAGKATDDDVVRVIVPGLSLLTLDEICKLEKAVIGSLLADGACSAVDREQFQARLAANREEADHAPRA